MEHLCPICNRKLTEDDHGKQYMDYHCFPPQSGHHYSKRIATDNSVLKVKVRLGSAEDRIFLKINFDEGFSEVWSDPDEDNRIKINHVWEPDLTDLDELRAKIKTYMLFS